MAGSSDAILRQTNAGFGVSAGASATAPTRSSRPGDPARGSAYLRPPFPNGTAVGAPGLAGSTPMGASGLGELRQLVQRRAHARPPGAERCQHLVDLALPTSELACRLEELLD